MTRQAVVYLARKGNPPRLTRAFLASLLRHPAGAPFDLILLLKGYAEGETDPAIAPYLGRLGTVEAMRIRDDIFPLRAFTELSQRYVAYERILFFNSFSRIRADNWLAHYLAAFEGEPRCGVVGATASHEAIEGGGFPNPAVRTNAFMISRRLFLELDKGPLKVKLDDNRFEAGPDGLTAQILRRGLAPLVVDRFGAAWPLERWAESRTFRSGRQEGLLVSDNRTVQFETGSARRRAYLGRLAFADRAEVSPISPLDRLAAAWEWRFPKV